MDPQKITLRKAYCEKIPTLIPFTCHSGKGKKSNRKQVSNHQELMMGTRLTAKWCEEIVGHLHLDCGIGHRAANNYQTL
jgi:hypothetical protein